MLLSKFAAVREKGYLQMELLVIITIIAALALAVHCRPELINTFALDGEARMLAMDLRWLQQSSMNIARGHSEFPAAKADIVPKMYFRIGLNGKYSILSGPATVKMHQFSHGVSIECNYNSISFNGDGYVNMPVTINLYQGTKQKKVIIDRVGRIRVSD